MTHLLFIKKIRLFSLLSFILPLIAINLCWVLYYYLGNLEKYRNITWTNNVTIISHQDYFKSNLGSFSNCPKYKFETIYKLNNGQELKYSKENEIKYSHNNYPKNYDGLKLKEYIFKHSKEKNMRCIKNHTFMNFLFSNLGVERLFTKIRDNHEQGFSLIKNPYFYGEVSISRTARYFPATLIFKPLLILSAFFLFLYWLNNFRFFNWHEENTKSKGISKKFFYFGALSCLFLFLHSIFLGINFDSQIYKIFRKVIIVLFIVFEVLAQIYLTIYIAKLSSGLKNYIKPIVLKIKVSFVFAVGFITVISFYILIFTEPAASFKHMLEWNYFSFLLIYYLLSNRLWK